MSIDYRADWRVTAATSVQANGCWFEILCWQLSNERWTYELATVDLHNLPDAPDGYRWVASFALYNDWGGRQLVQDVDDGVDDFYGPQPEFDTMEDAMQHAQTLFVWTTYVEPSLRAPEVPAPTRTTTEGRL